MTITRAKGEGNGHFYHIEVIDLPFHTIPFVSFFFTRQYEKMNFYWKFTTKFGIIFCASKFTGQSIFSFVYYASFDAQLCAQPRAVRADNDNGRCLIKSRLRFNRARPMLILIHWPSSDFTVCTRGTLRDIHRIHVYYENGRVKTHWPWNSWGNYFMIMKWFGMSHMKVYGTILVGVI